MMYVVRPHMFIVHCILNGMLCICLPLFPPTFQLLVHAGDRQLVFGFASYLIDVHKRKDNLRGEAGEGVHARDVRQPAAAASAGGDEQDGVGLLGVGRKRMKGGDDCCRTRERKVRRREPCPRRRPRWRRLRRRSRARSRRSNSSSLFAPRLILVSSSDRNLQCQKTCLPTPKLPRR